MTIAERWGYWSDGCGELTETASRRASPDLWAGFAAPFDARISIVPFHATVTSADRGGQVLRFFNMDEDTFRRRLLDPYELGTTLTARGTTIPAEAVSHVLVFETDEEILDSDANTAWRSVRSSGREVTDDWITTGPGSREAPVEPSPSQTAPAPLVPEPIVARDPRRVMVVHGRNYAAREAMFTFLGALGLQPIEWTQAVTQTGVGSPHNLVAVRAAMEWGQAVVVVLTAEDQARLSPELAAPNETDELEVRGQPRQNVILEAGVAMGIDARRVILVQLGRTRGASDFDGLNRVSLDNSGEARADLRNRLRAAGCEVDESATRWMSQETGGDFERGLIDWRGEAAALREGQVDVARPNAYAFANLVRLRLPLVFRNTDARAVILSNLRLRIEDEPDRRPLEWITTRSLLRPEPDDGFAFATPFAIDPFGTRELIAEFGDDLGWSPAPGSHHRLVLQALVHPSEDWVTVATLDWWAPPPDADQTRYLTHRNEPPDSGS